MLYSNKKSSNQTSILKSWKYSLVLLIVSALILGLMILLGSDFDLSQLHSLLTQLEPDLIFSLLLLSCINFTLRALRWHWFSWRLDLDIPLIDSTINYIAGFAMGVTPGRMGELIRLWLLRRDFGISYSRAMPMMIADRINDLLVIIVLSLGSGMLTGAASLNYIVIALLFLISSNTILRHPHFLIVSINALYAVTKKWHRVFAAARRTLRTGRVMFSISNAAFASIFSLIAWFAECLAFYLLLSALGTEISLESAAFIYTFATLVGALSFLPGGLGGFEVTALLLLSASGIEITTAIFATSVIRLTTLWFSVALGSFTLTYVLFNKRTNDGKKR